MLFGGDENSIELVPRKRKSVRTLRYSPKKEPTQKKPKWKQPTLDLLLHLAHTHVDNSDPQDSNLADMGPSTSNVENENIAGFVNFAEEEAEVKAKPKKKVSRPVLKPLSPSTWTFTKFFELQRASSKKGKTTPKPKKSKTPPKEGPKVEDKLRQRTLEESFSLSHSSSSLNRYDPHPHMTSLTRSMFFSSLLELTPLSQEFSKRRFSPTLAKAT